MDFCRGGERPVQWQDPEAAQLHQDLESTSCTPQAQCVLCWEQVQKPTALPLTADPSSVLHVQQWAAELQVSNKQTWLLTRCGIKWQNSSWQHAGDSKALRDVCEKKNSKKSWTNLLRWLKKTPPTGTRCPGRLGDYSDCQVSPDACSGSIPLPRHLVLFQQGQLPVGTVYTSVPHLTPPDYRLYPVPS